MITLLGIDVGLVKTGVARAESGMAEPLAVIPEKDLEKLVRKIKLLVLQERADSVIIGMPEGKIAELAKALGKNLQKEGIKIIFWPEDLTTQDAQRLAIEAGIKKSKRQELEDAWASAVMLQSYIESEKL